MESKCHKFFSWAKTQKFLKNIYYTYYFLLFLFTSYTWTLAFNEIFSVYIYDELHICIFMHVSEHIFILMWLKDTHIFFAHPLSAIVCHSVSQGVCHRPIHYKHWIVFSQGTISLIKTNNG